MHIYFLFFYFYFYFFWAGKGTHIACVLSEGIIKFTATVSNELNCKMGKDELTWSVVLDNEDEAAGD